jgi:phosphate transport system protein
MRENFERDLRHLQDEVLVLGSMVEGALGDAVDVLKRRDMPGSYRLVAYDRRVNEKRFAIEDHTLTLIATQQPMAGDLRTLAAVLEIITELERIGDYAKGIARINLMLADKPLVKPLVDIPLMAKKAQEMLHRSLDAFVLRDVPMARAVAIEDDALDTLYNQVHRDLLELVMADIHRLDEANYLLWVAHNLERVGDRVTNICERVVFTVTGEMVELNGSEASMDAANFRDPHEPVLA